MPTPTKPRSPHMRIVVGLPDLQGHLRMVDRLSDTASEPDQSRWQTLGTLLSELYTQLQHQKQVVVHRFGTKSMSAGRKRT